LGGAARRRCSGTSRAAGQGGSVARIAPCDGAAWRRTARRTLCLWVPAGLPFFLLLRLPSLDLVTRQFPYEAVVREEADEGRRGMALRWCSSCASLARDRIGRLVRDE